MKTPTKNLEHTTQHNTPHTHTHTHTHTRTQILAKCGDENDLAKFGFFWPDVVLAKCGLAKCGHDQPLHFGGEQVNFCGPSKMTTIVRSVQKGTWILEGFPHFGRRSLCGGDLTGVPWGLNYCVDLPEQP